MPDPASTSIVKAAAEAIGETAKEETKSIVQKLLGPATEEVGELLRLAVRSRTSGLRTRLLTANEAAEVAFEDATRKLRNSSPDALREPDPSVVAGVIEGMQTRAAIPELRDMFTSLLAASMQAGADAPHPAFSEIIRQLVPDEARLLALVVGLLTTNRWTWKYASVAVAENGSTIHFRSSGTVPRQIQRGAIALAQAAALAEPHRGVAYLENLARLGVIEIELRTPAETGGRAERKDYSSLDQKWPSFEARFGSSTPQSAVLRLTAFGQQFAKACVSERSVLAALAVSDQALAAAAARSAELAAAKAAENEADAAEAIMEAIRAAREVDNPARRTDG